MRGLADSPWASLPLKCNLEQRRTTFTSSVADNEGSLENRILRVVVPAVFGSLAGVMLSSWYVQKHTFKTSNCPLWIDIDFGMVHPETEVYTAVQSTVWNVYVSWRTLPNTLCSYTGVFVFLPLVRWHPLAWRCRCHNVRTTRTVVTCRMYVHVVIHLKSEYIDIVKKLDICIYLQTPIRCLPYLSFFEHLYLNMFNNDHHNEHDFSTRIHPKISHNISIILNICHFSRSDEIPTHSIRMELHTLYFSWQDRVRHQSLVTDPEAALRYYVVWSNGTFISPRLVGIASWTAPPSFPNWLVVRPQLILLVLIVARSSTLYNLAFLRWSIRR